jgi:hypothetical protein
MITNAEIEGFIFGVPEGNIPVERIEWARQEYCQPFCGDHLVKISECGCKIWARVWSN